MIRQPIVSVLGHVDHGKTTFLDKIRGTKVAAKEAGGITQHIGATEIPIETIKEICGDLLVRFKIGVTLPGLLFIDTPGHEAFTSLRKRGGALADLAVLIVDVKEGFQVQTHESLNILKECRTPFLVAINKIDLLQGWKVHENASFLKNFGEQKEEVKELLDRKVYEVVGLLHEAGFSSERFDRVKKFEREISIVPVSALTGEGIPDLLMILLGLAQRFLGEQLKVEVEGTAKGTVLEVNEERGLGATIDVIIYDGKLKKGDSIVVGGKTDVIRTKVRSLLRPKPLDEIREPRFRFDMVDAVSASCGIKIAAPNLKETIAGSPLWGFSGDVEGVEEIRREIEGVKIRTDAIGVVLKADTLGSLEALTGMLGSKGVPIRMADVGDVSRRDVVEAETAKGGDFTKGAIIAFNVEVPKEIREIADSAGVGVFEGNVIYRLIEDYETWVKEVVEGEKKQRFEMLVRPGKIRILKGYVFRQSKPAIVGIEVVGGTLRKDYRLMNGKGVVVGVVKAIEEKNKTIKEATAGMQVAVSIDGPTVGRQINEEDFLYNDVPAKDMELLLTKYREYLNEGDLQTFEEIKKIKGVVEGGLF